MIKRDHSEITEIHYQAAAFDLSHHSFEVARVTRIFRAARGHDDGIEPALFQDSQRVDHYLMIFVPPEMVG